MENTFILNTSDYTFTKFSSGGFSGNIFLATPIKADLPKLLIKSDNPCSACNEFMYSRIGRLLGVITPNVYIMNVASKDGNNFGSPYVVGIEYMDGMHRFTLEEMHSSKLWKKEYAEQYALAALFDQDDLVQLTMRADGHITGFDFTETFWLSNMSISLFQLPDDQLSTVLHNRLIAMHRRGLSYIAAGASAVRKHFGEDDTAPVPAEYLSPMRKLIQLTEAQIEEITINLDEIYPISISVYFEEYIKLLKCKVSAYLKSVESQS